MAGALGGRHEHVHAGGGDDLLIADVKAVGEGQGLALGHVGGDVLLIDLGLHLVVDEHHNDVAPLGGLGHGLDGQTGLLRLGPVLGALAQAHAHVAAGVLQVEGVGVALGAVADDGDLLAVEVGELAVLLVVHLSHGNTLLFIQWWLLIVYDSTGGNERMITMLQSRKRFGRHPRRGVNRAPVPARSHPRPPGRWQRSAGPGTNGRRRSYPG